MTSHAEISQLLAGFAAGTCGDQQRGMVAAHVASCVACRAELDSWRAIRSATTAAAPPPAPPRPQVLAEVLDQIGAAATRPQPPVGRPRRLGLQHAATVLVGQLPLVLGRLWAASALVIGLGGLLAALGTHDMAGLVLTLTAPVVAAAGLAVVYGPGLDPGLELARATPTSPRTVLLARLTVVFGYNAAVAALVSVILVLAGATGVGLWPLVASWLGPMALLSALSLAASVWIGPAAAMGLALVLWTARLVTGTGAGLIAGPWVRLMDSLWSTSPATLAAAVVIVAAAVLTGPRRQWRPQLPVR